MPVYEFKCECGQEKEALVPMGTKTIKCNRCGEAMSKTISLCTFHLKGTGWYATDYNNKSEKQNKKN